MNIWIKFTFMFIAIFAYLFFNDKIEDCINWIFPGLIDTDTRNTSIIITKVTDKEQTELEEQDNNTPLKVEIANSKFNVSKIKEYKGGEIKSYEFRPQNFTQFIGQKEGKERAKTIIKKANRGMKAHFLVDGIKGHGKCHRKGTKILMANGTLKKIEKILPKDEVMGIDSKAKKVKKIGYGYGKMYKIITKGKEFVVNAEHILSLRKTGTKDNTINISVKDFLNSPTTITQRYELYRVPINFPKKSIPLNPYFLGLWLGDGNSNDSRITNIDSIIWNWLKEYAIKLNLIFTHSKSKNRASYLCLSSGRGGNAIGDKRRNRFNIKNELRKLNLLNNKHIPYIYKCNNKENRLKLLAGLIDSDGWLNDGCCYEICSKWEILANDIKYLAQSLGFFSYISFHYVKLSYWKKPRKYYRVHIIGNVITIPVKLTRKKAKIRKINKNPLYTGFKIKKLIKKEKYYGFELEGNHLYIIEDFIVNHNTTFVNLIAKQLNAKLIERVGKQIDEESLVNIVNEINTSTEKHVVFFIDEIESLDWKVLKVLNPIIEQFSIAGKKIKPFIFCGATINKHIILTSNPDTLDRIGTHIKFQRYNAEEIATIITQYKKELYPNEQVSQEVIKTISENCKFNPRESIALLEDYIVEQNIKKTLKDRRIVINGLTEIDIVILTTLNNATRAMGANNLAMKAKLSQKEYVTEFEPFLVEYDYINRVPSRILTDKGKKLLEEL